MSKVDAGLTIVGNLDKKLVKSSSMAQLHELLRTPFGRLMWTKDKGEAIRAGQWFTTHLQADHFNAQGKMLERYDLGSGLVTNVGVMAMANDFAWSGQLNLSTLGLANNHAWGTGTTAAATTDVQLQTAVAPTTTTAVAGVQSLLTATLATGQKYQSVATITQSVAGPVAITEWALLSNLTMSATTGSPFTAGSATTGTVTGTALTASSATVRGNQQFIFKDTSAGTPFYGLVLSNTTSVITVPAWYTVAGGLVSGSNPASSDAYTIQPVAWDHRVFSAVNTSLNDSIVFTYTVTINSGG